MSVPDGDCELVRMYRNPLQSFVAVDDADPGVPLQAVAPDDWGAVAPDDWGAVANPCPGHLLPGLEGAREAPERRFIRSASEVSVSKYARVKVFRKRLRR